MNSKLAIEIDDHFLEVSGKGMPDCNIKITCCCLGSGIRLRRR